MIENIFIDEYAAKVGTIACVVYMALNRHADINRQCYPSLTLLSKECGVARSSVQAAIKKLVEHDCVKITSRLHDNGSLTSNLYCLPTLYRDAVGGIPDTGTPYTGDKSTLYRDAVGGIPPVGNEQDPIEQDSIKKTQRTKQTPSASPLANAPAGSEMVLFQSETSTAAKKVKERVPSFTGPTWNAYKAAYCERYGFLPVDNQRVRACLSNFIKRIGIESAPLVAEFYVSLNSRWYVEKGHTVPIMLGDAEKLHTEWQRGKSVTSREATEADRLQGVGDMWREIIEERRESRNEP